MKYYLHVILPGDAVLELQRSARERNLPANALITEILEDYLDTFRIVEGLAGSVGKPTCSGSHPRKNRRRRIWTDL